jgi:hypothetical protein
MGVVNEAEDLMVQRHVAPNFLPCEMENDLMPVNTSCTKRLLARRPERPVKIVLDFGENEDQLLRVGISVQPKVWAR